MKRVRMDAAARVRSTLAMMVGEVNVRMLTEGVAEQIRIGVVAFHDGARNTLHSHECE